MTFEIPPDYWANQMAAMMARLDGEPPATSDQAALLEAIDQINAGRGMPLTACKIIVFERAAATGWRCSFLDGPLPHALADDPILTPEIVEAERALAWSMHRAEVLHGTGNV